MNAVKVLIKVVIIFLIFLKVNLEKFDCLRFDFFVPFLSVERKATYPTRRLNINK